MKFVCPSCNIHLQAEADLAGKTVKCPGCSTKIQIPADFGQPAAPKINLPVPSINRPTLNTGAAAKSSAAAAETTPEESYESEYEAGTEEYIPPLQMDHGQSGGPHPSEISMLYASLSGIAATGFWYLIMVMLPKRSAPDEPITIGIYMREMFCEREWPQVITTLLTFWCAAILIFKYLNIRKQRRAMLLEALPTDISPEINARNLSEFHTHVLHFPKPLRNTFIVNRIRKALEFFHVRQNNPEVAQMISSQSDVDANKVGGSYGIVKVFLWAIPIMGFIGTVLGIGQAIGGFGQVLQTGDSGDVSKIVGALTPVLGSMGVAFDTTLLALVFSMLLSFPASSLQGSEEDLVTSVDEYCIDNLLKRLNDGGTASQLGTDSALINAIGDAITSNQKDFLGKFEDTQRQMADNLSGQTKNYERVAHLIDKQIEGVEKRTDSFEKRVDVEMVRALERITEGVKNLNAVLKDLDGKQVVVQKKGWFSRG